jgi:phenylalanine-4-hydroxylase
MFKVSNDRPGALTDHLKCFFDNHINLTRIESKPTSSIDARKGYTFIVSAESTASVNLEQAMTSLRQITEDVTVLSGEEVPWFPRSLSDLEHFEQTVLEAGADLQCDHPSFNDKVYRTRREELAQIAKNYRFTDGEVPRVKYKDYEIETWSKVFTKLRPLYARYACTEYLEALEEMRKHCKFNEDTIPQLADINKHLQTTTGFLFRPISGMLSGRDFLNSLALRVFCSTQYIRHHSEPDYTPEPDIIHELMGHAPMFANKEFADFSQELGLASLGASDEDIVKLSTCFLFSVEFGLLQTSTGQRKAYGAGVLSSIKELEHSMSSVPEFRFFDPKKACSVLYPITTVQPIYFCSNSFVEAKEQMSKFASTIVRPFNACFDPESLQVLVDSKVKVSK